MISMKSGDKDYADTVSDNQYGCGLMIYLNSEQCANLGIKEPMRAGTKLKLTALAYVDESNESVGDSDGDEADGNEYSLSLQITDLELGAARDAKESAKGLYPEQNGG